MYTLSNKQMEKQTNKYTQTEKRWSIADKQTDIYETNKHRIPRDRQTKAQTETKQTGKQTSQGSQTLNYKHTHCKQKEKKLDKTDEIKDLDKTD